MLLDLTVFYKTLPALWTCDFNFAMSLWNSHFLFTGWALEKFICFPLCHTFFHFIPFNNNSVSKIYKFLIFLYLLLTFLDIILKYICPITANASRSKIHALENIDIKRRTQTNIDSNLASSSAPFLPTINLAIFSLITFPHFPYCYSQVQESSYPCKNA